MIDTDISPTAAKDHHIRLLEKEAEQLRASLVTALNEQHAAQAGVVGSQAREAKLREALALALGAPGPRQWDEPGDVENDMAYWAKAKPVIDAAIALEVGGSALVEVCERVALEVHTFCITDKYAAGVNLKSIVARVLGGKP